MEIDFDWTFEEENTVKRISLSPHLKLLVSCKSTTVSPNLGLWVWGKEALISKYLSTQLQAMEAAEYVEFPFKAAKHCNSMDRMSQGLKVWDKNEWIINFWGNVHLALCSLHILITKSSEGFIFATIVFSRRKRNCLNGYFAINKHLKSVL